MYHDNWNKSKRGLQVIHPEAKVYYKYHYRVEAASLLKIHNTEEFI